jgi:hypothetical protein
MTPELSSRAINPPSMTRRDLLAAAALTGLSAALPETAVGRLDAERPEWRTAVTAFLETLSRPDGGYAWADQPEAHLTPTFAVIGCYHLLKEQPPNKAKAAEFVRQHHPSRLKKLEQELRGFEFQQIQSLLWLGEDASAFREQVRSWKKPTVYFKQYEQSGNPIFSFELLAFICRSLLGLPLNDLTPEFTTYLNARRRANGSFNATPAADGSDGHVTNTWWGLQALRVLDRTGEKKEETVRWLRACQLPNGGFTYQPKPEFAGIDDVMYTWAAVRALKELESVPADREACIRYLGSLWNADGGFGDRPGWLSNAVASYYALEALEALGALGSAPLVKKPAPAVRAASLPANLKVFTIQIQAHGQGSPAEAVDLAHSLRIHLWGAKNAKPEWIKRAQQLANQRKVPVTFFVANEEYGTWVSVPGLGTYSHTSDIMAPPGVDFGPSLSNQGAVTWPVYREKRLAPLQKVKGGLVWQFGENEEITRIYLDDSLQRGGYMAISTFHFGNPDFTNSEPFLQRYRQQLPFIGLQDAHGNEPWWFADMTTGFRTVFLATEATWEGWLTALRRNWVVAVRHDAVSGFKTWMHGGPSEVVDFVKQHERDWRWWDNAPIERPLVSIVAVRPADEFEAARPEKGVTIRVRCAWENTTQGLPKKPLVELVKLIVDGEEVSAKLVEKKRTGAGPAYADHYHEFHLPSLLPGKHTVKAVVRDVGSKVESSRSIEFNE